MLTFDLIRLNASQRALFGGFDRERSAALMTALDDVNRRWGRGSLRVASTGLARSWSTKFELRSPRYTTRVEELPILN